MPRPSGGAKLRALFGGQRFFRPVGARIISLVDPGLAHGAAFWRRFAAWTKPRFALGLNHFRRGRGNLKLHLLLS